MSPWFAMSLAPAVQPWALIGAGAATVTQAKLSSWESYLALFAFCILAPTSYLAMEIYAVVRPDQNKAFLDSLGMKNPSAWSYSEREWLYVGSARTHRATSRWT
jgi:hypothetical protein